MEAVLRHRPGSGEMESCDRERRQPDPRPPRMDRRRATALRRGDGGLRQPRARACRCGRRSPSAGLVSRLRVPGTGSLVSVSAADAEHLSLHSRRRSRCRRRLAGSRRSTRAGSECRFRLPPAHRLQAVGVAFRATNDSDVPGRAAIGCASIRQSGRPPTGLLRVVRKRRYGSPARAVRITPWG